MAEDHHPGVDAGQSLQLVGDDRGYATQPREPEGVRSTGDRVSFGIGDTFGHHHQRVGLPFEVSPGETVAQCCEVVGHFGYQDRLGATGEAGVESDPTRVPPHDLDDHDPIVGLGGGGQAVDGFGDDMDCGVEPKRDIGPTDVVVDGLGDPDHGKPLPTQLDRGPQRSVASDHHQNLDPRILQGRGDRFQAATVDVRILPGRPQDGPSPMGDATHVITAEQPGPPLHQAGPPVLDPDHDRLGGHGAGNHRPDGGIEPRTVSSGGEDPDRRHVNSNS